MSIEFTRKPIICLGDVMLDEYVYGEAIRLSPEAPVPIMRVTHSEYRLGGAANVAANIKALGGNPVLLGVVGDDLAGINLKGLAHNAGIAMELLTLPELTTTQKMRLIANGQQIARMDREMPTFGQPGLTRYARRALQGAGAVVISDYNKGVVTQDLLDDIVWAAVELNVPVFLDPRVAHAKYYQACAAKLTCMTPNLAEAAGLLGDEPYASLPDDAGRMLRTYPVENTLVTLGAAGMVLFEYTEGKELEVKESRIPAAARAVFDVAGAGDTVIATLALAHASGYSMLAAAEYANVAAGLVVGKPGTATVSCEELEEEAYHWFAVGGTIDGSKVRRGIVGSRGIIGG